VLAATLPQDRIGLARQRDDARHASLCDHAHDRKIEIDLRPGQQQLGAAQAGDDGEAAQLGEIDILDLVERGFLGIRDK
jgi:hypothetical protein